MSLLPTNQQDQIKVGVAIVSLALGVYFYMYPYSERALAVEETRARVERLETANLKAEREIARGSAKTLKQQAARSRATLEVLRQLVPTVHEVPALLEEVSTAARRAGLELGGVQPEPVLAGDTFDTYRYKLTVAGSYHELTTFLANTGSLPRIVAPVTFALAPLQGRSDPRATPGRGAATKSVLQATVTIQTYVARSAPAPAASAGEVLQ